MSPDITLGNSMVFPNTFGSQGTDWASSNSHTSDDNHSLGRKSNLSPVKLSPPRTAGKAIKDRGNLTRPGSIVGGRKNKAKLQPISMKDENDTIKESTVVEGLTQEFPPPLSPASTILNGCLTSGRTTTRFAVS